MNYEGREGREGNTGMAFSELAILSSVEARLPMVMTAIEVQTHLCCQSERSSGFDEGKSLRSAQPEGWLEWASKADTLRGATHAFHPCIAFAPSRFS